jgi:hypothetical protein
MSRSSCFFARYNRQTLTQGRKEFHMGCFDYFLPIKLADAEIRAIAPAGGETHRVRFILKTYKLEKKNDFSEISAPGLNGEPLQFVRSHSRTLSTVFYFDERATNTASIDEERGGFNERRSSNSCAAGAFI